MYSANNIQLNLGVELHPHTPITTHMPTTLSLAHTLKTNLCLTPGTVVVPSHSHYIGASISPSMGHQVSAGTPIPKMFDQYMRYSDYSSSMHPDSPSYHKEGSHTNSVSELEEPPNSCVPPVLLYSTLSLLLLQVFFPSPTSSGNITPSPTTPNSLSKPISWCINIYSPHWCHPLPTPVVFLHPSDAPTLIATSRSSKLMG